MIKPKIQVTLKNVYGKELLYPVCDKAKLFASIAGEKTLTFHTVNLVYKLGYDIEQVIEKSEILKF